MKHSEIWEQVRRLILRGKKFVLTTHVNPDGDAIGSEIALAAFLEQMGKEAVIFNSSPTPDNYRFLDPHGVIQIFDPSQDRGELLSADGFFILDISDWKRLKDVGAAIRGLPAPRVCIDHHIATEEMAEIQLIDEHASSTGELIYELIVYCEGEVKDKIADALYTCILTDTGSFRFSNTNPRAHEITASLIKSGVQPQDIYQRVYERGSPARMRLLGHVINGLHYECDGKVVWFSITQEMLNNSGAQPWEAEGFAEFPRSIDGVEVTAMFMELNGGRVKVSLRSKGQVGVNEVAVKLGGGGHRYAAGSLMRGCLEDIIEKVLDEVRRLF